MKAEHMNYASGLGAIAVCSFALLACSADTGASVAKAARTTCLTTRAAEATSGDMSAMVWIPAGSVVMGSDNFEPEEQPRHREDVAGFWIDRHEVTNRQFRAFVDATGYVTVAERRVSGEAAQDLSEELRQPGGIVFRLPDETERKAPDESDPWWRWTPGANWRRPEGPGSSIEGRDDFPVLQIGYADAQAYARWHGGSLPTEAQWERAARGDHQGRDYIWGEEPYPKGRQMANSWQGPFPVKDEGLDGFTGVAPVGCFPANDFGLYDMAGNVWEWTEDNFATRREIVGRVDGQPVTIRGGSWLCAPNYCGRFRPAARQPGDPTTGTNHIGFRIVKLGPEPDESAATKPGQAAS